ncbi:hypothetical protein FD25_GL001349 [Levilactobacillus acidifarinae DSM 19394]|uniref:Uncharacterized protein n=2 Tax=Levilactobacillus acidifarinae TaxID=267364 RepID=A0A0R1LLV5_9LACO|nr:hypothetical protein FD25_GL001349 [Levilactobacillus acidifarinae DSM 19394]
MGVITMFALLGSWLSLIVTFLAIFFFVYGVVTFCYQRWDNHKKRSAKRKLQAWAKPTGVQYWTVTKLEPNKH